MMNSGVNGKTVLLTGCAGFIGFRFLKHILEMGYNVIGLDAVTYAATNYGEMLRLLEKYGRFRFHFSKGDICDEWLVNSLCQKYKPNSIINYAAESSVDKSIKASKEFLRTNVDGVRSLLESCRKHNIGLLHISTDEVTTYPGKLAKETDALNPKNPYSASKAAAEHLINAYRNTYGIRSTIVRMTNNFGPGQHYEKFMPTIVRELASGYSVPVYGNGRQKRTWMYVDEGVKMVEFLLSYYRIGDIVNGVVNIAPGLKDRNKENLDIVYHIASVMKDMNIDLPAQIVNHIEDRPGHDLEYGLDISLMKFFTTSYFYDFEEHFLTSFDDAVETTVKYYVEKMKAAEK